MVTIVLMVALVVFGLFALSVLKTDEFPEVEQPVLVVILAYPGGSPDGVEQEVLTPVEDAIAGLSGIDQLYGSAADGYAQIIALFEFGKNMEQASQEVRDAISGIRRDLPVEMEEPIIQRIDPGDLPVFSVVLTSSTLSPVRLRQIAEDDVQHVIEALTGVGKVTVSGGETRALSIELLPDLMASAGVDVAGVVGAIRAQNIEAPVGRLSSLGSGSEQSLRLRPMLQSPEDFAALAIGSGAGGNRITLGQVARINDGSEESRSVAIHDGTAAVVLDVIKTRDASTTDVSARIHETVDRVRSSLPPGTTLEVIRDSGERVAASVSNVNEALLEGALLTVLVVFLFLNSWRSTVITGLALPVSVLASFVAVWAFGFTLNTMSLLGLSLAIGILIDDAIVVRENIVRHIERGVDHFQAAREGTAEIGLAVAATTFSIVAVFVPIAFIDGVAGQWFQPFALTIACSVLVSLFVSFSLDPMLSAYWPDPQKEAHEQNWLSRKLDRFNDWFNGLAHGYRRVVGWALDYPKTVVVLATLSMVSAIALPATGIIGGAFMPPDDASELTVKLNMAPGSNMAMTAAKAEAIARIARAHPEVKATTTTVGNGQGGVDQASVYVRLVPMAERSIGAEPFADVIRSEIVGIPGVEASVFTNDFAGGQKRIQLQLRGQDREALQRAADAVMAEVLQVDGAVDVGLSTRGQKPELEVAIDHDRALALGVTTSQIAQALLPAYAGLDLGNWTDPEGKTRKVMVRLAPEARADVEDVGWLTLRSPTAGPVPLFEVARLTEGLGPALVQHLDREPVITVEANTQGRPLSAIREDIDARLAGLTLPGSVKLSQGGEVESQNEVFGSIFAALGLGVLLMYLVLVLQFGSFLDPIAILVSLPLSLIGVMLALLVTGQTVNLMSLIGVILLAGIVAKNAILLIDFAKEAKKRGLSARDALVEAGGIRLRPILMTTAALVAGMIPVALGGGEGALFRRPLGIAVIGGVITSTLLTLIVIPVVWELLDRMRDRVHARLHRKARAHE